MEQEIQDARTRKDLASQYRVVGVDIAPAKRSTICYLEAESGQIKLENLQAPALRERLDKWREEQTLLVWDAPLTAVPPQYWTTGQASGKDRHFTIRAIEKHYRKTDLPKGVSVQGYASCQHWTITRFLLGLPIVGPYCSQDLPYVHLTEEGSLLAQAVVVETHPALALYLLFLGHVGSQFYRYKGRGLKAEERDKNLGIICDELCSWLEEIGLEELAPADIEIKKVDDLDAYVCWLLGMVWLRKESTIPVAIEGNAKTGSMLLPSTTLSYCV